MEAPVAETVEPLIADLVEWVSKAPRSYEDVMDAWRTSCPRLPVWEDAVDRGYLSCERLGGGSTVVRVTPKGLKFLADRGHLPSRATATQT